MKVSSFLNLNLQDLGKGILVAIITAILGSLMPIINAGHLPTGADFKVIGMGALTAGVAYLLKNLFTPTPTVVQIDPTKTSVVDKDTKQVLA